MASLSRACWRVALRVYEQWKIRDRWSRERNRNFSFEVGSGELPFPPSALRVRVAGTADIESFLDGGVKASRSIRELLAECGRPLETCGSFLDFGCGCGRVLRHWKDLSGVSIFGTDLDGEQIRWCQQRLPFASVCVNGVRPPIPLEVRVDVIYAFSVFTHMPLDLQREWLAEFARILNPGGLLIFSTHGSHYLPRLNAQERARFLSGQMVIRMASAAGSNFCNTYHPESFVRGELASGWEVVIFRPEGALGNPRQDVWVFRRG